MLEQPRRKAQRTDRGEVRIEPMSQVTSVQLRLTHFSLCYRQYAAFDRVLAEECFENGCALVADPNLKLVDFFLPVRINLQGEQQAEYAFVPVQVSASLNVRSMTGLSLCLCQVKCLGRQLSDTELVGIAACLIGAPGTSEHLPLALVINTSVGNPEGSSVLPVESGWAVCLRSTSQFPTEQDIQSTAPSVCADCRFPNHVIMSAALNMVMEFAWTPN